MSDGGSTALLLLRMVLSLGLVLVLLVLFVRVINRRRGGPATRRAGAPCVTVEVLNRTQLSRSASLQVIRVAGNDLLIGVGDHGVTFLRDLDLPETPVEEPKADEESKLPSFVAALAKQGRAKLPEGVDSLLERVARSQANLSAEAVQDIMNRGGKHRG